MIRGKDQPKEEPKLHFIRRRLGVDAVAGYLIRLYLGAAATVGSAAVLKLLGAPAAGCDLVSGLVFLGSLMWAEIAHTEENDEWEDVYEDADD